MNKEELVSLDYETECNRLKQKLNNKQMNGQKNWIVLFMKRI